MDYTVENEGTELACREVAGPGACPDAAPLVCVHGACVDGTFFDGIARELGRSRRVVIYDRRGAGESSAAADDRYDVATQAEDLAAVIEHVGAPCDILAHSAGTLVTLELLCRRPELVRRAILHEPAVSGEGAGLGTDPGLVELVESGKASRALGSTEAEAKHMLRDGRTFMAHEYTEIMTYGPRWDQVAAGKVVAVGLGDRSLDTSRATGAHATAARLGCPVVAFPGAHNGLRDLPREAAWIVQGILEDLPTEA